MPAGRSLDPRQIRTYDLIPERRSASPRSPEIAGRCWRAQTFATPDEAEDHLRHIARANRDGRYTPPSELTVQELVDAFLERSRGRWKPNSYATNRAYADKLILPDLGNRRAVELTARDVQRWIDRLTARKLGASTIANAQNILGAALREAALGIIPTNPVTGTRLPKRRRAAMQTWSADEVRTVLTTLATEPAWRPLYLVALTTGMRPGELRALQWDDVDFTAGTVIVRRTITRDEQFHAIVGSSTKTERERVIALSAIVLAALREHRQAQLARRRAHPDWHGAFVFDRGNGDFLPASTWQRFHRALMDRTSVTRIRLHDLRHTYATLELAAGPPKIVSERMGHASIAITLDRYTHLDISLQQRAAEALAARLFPSSPATTEPPDAAESGEFHA